MPSSAGKGFGASNKPSNYQTIFEKIKAAAAGQRQSVSWYRNQLKTLSASYKSEQLISDERREQYDDLQDENELRTTVRRGHLYFFEYKAKMKYLPYYDKFPLGYVFKRDADGFYAANFHYLGYKSRVKAMQKLERGLIDIPRVIVHKYLSDYVESLYLDLAPEEWETSVLLPVEDFVLTKGNGRIPYDRELVWEEIKQNESEKIKAKAVIKEY